MTSSVTALQSKANPQQLEAILATDGPVLIIAGPGSGKTFTLVERIVYLITHKGVAPESLLVVTFTDKAARELTTRISNRLAELNIQFNLNEMYLGTFHSICLRLLEDYREFTRLKRSFTLFDQFDQQYFLYQHIKDFRELPDAELVIGDNQTSRWAQSENLLKWLNRVSEEALDASVLAAATEVERPSHASTTSWRALSGRTTRSQHARPSCARAAICVLTATTRIGSSGTTTNEQEHTCAGKPAIGHTRWWQHQRREVRVRAY